MVISSVLAVFSCQDELLHNVDWLRVKTYVATNRTEITAFVCVCLFVFLLFFVSTSALPSFRLCFCLSFIVLPFHPSSLISPPFLMFPFSLFFPSSFLPSFLPFFSSFFRFPFYLSVYALFHSFVLLFSYIPLNFETFSQLRFQIFWDASLCRWNTGSGRFFVFKV